MRKWYAKIDDPDMMGAVMRGNMTSIEKVAGFRRNARPLCSGLGGRLRPKRSVGLSGIHSAWTCGWPCSALKTPDNRQPLLFN